MGTILKGERVMSELKMAGAKQPLFFSRMNLKKLNPEPREDVLLTD